MKLEFFKPEDFPNYTYYQNAIDAAKSANAKLNSALGPVVYGNDASRMSYVAGTCPIHWTGVGKDSATHQAHLFQIQPIVKEPCVHEPDHVGSWEWGPDIQNPFIKVKCKHCGQKLKATWSVE